MTASAVANVDFISASSQQVTCAICRNGKPKIFQRQHLSLAGLGDVDLDFGYCRVCGHIYQTKRASEETMRKNYVEFSNYAYFDDVRDQARESTRRLFGLASSTIGVPGSVYEVGSSYGMHLKHFKDNGWTVGGCDLSPRAAKEAKELFGIDIDCGDESSVLRTKSGYDLVYLSHVLEHIAYPVQTLHRVWRALKPNGFAMFEVPLAAEPEKQPPGLFSLEHFHYFSVQGAERLMRQSGFEVVKYIRAYKLGFPVITIIGSKTRGIPTFKDTIDVGFAEEFLEDYLSMETRTREAIRERISEVYCPVYIWGAGVHTAQLLDRVPYLRKLKILGIVDRSELKWGQTQAGVKVIGPSEYYAKCGGASLIISSFAYEDDIYKDAVSNGIEPSRIIRLYNRQGE